MIGTLVLAMYTRMQVCSLSLKRWYRMMTQPSILQKSGKHARVRAREWRNLNWGFNDETIARTMNVTLDHTRAQRRKYAPHTVKGGVKSHHLGLQPKTYERFRAVMYGRPARSITEWNKEFKYPHEASVHKIFRRAVRDGQIAHVSGTGKVNDPRLYRWNTQ